MAAGLPVAQHEEQQQGIISSGGPKSVKHDPGAAARIGQALALMNQGDALLTKGDPDGAIALYRKSLATDVFMGQAYVRMSDAYAVKGDMENAVASFRKLVYPEPHQVGAGNDPRLMFKYALLLCRVKLYNEAARIYDQGMDGFNAQSDPPSPALPPHLTPLSAHLPAFEAMCHVGLAITALWQGEDKAREAAEHCREATRLEPNSALAWYYLGRALSQARDPAGAREAYGRAAGLGRGAAQDAARLELAILAARFPSR